MHSDQLYRQVCGSKDAASALAGFLWHSLQCVCTGTGVRWNRRCSDECDLRFFPSGFLYLCHHQCGTWDSGRTLRGKGISAESVPDDDTQLSGYRGVGGSIGSVKYPFLRWQNREYLGRRCDRSAWTDGTDPLVLLCDWRVLRGLSG